MYIVFEGIDGSGKTTQLARLAAVLASAKVNYTTTAEPTLGKHGQRLRRGGLSLDEERRLFVADRREHTELVLEPSLRSGSLVLSDRSYYSSVAYQGALGGWSSEELLSENSFAPHPDVPLWIDCSPVAAAARVDGRGLGERTDHLAAVRDRYALLGLVRVDGSGSIESVARSIIAACRHPVSGWLMDSGQVYASRRWLAACKCS
jgi:dTMP kinase